MLGKVNHNNNCVFVRTVARFGFPFVSLDWRKRNEGRRVGRWCVCVASCLPQFVETTTTNVLGFYSGFVDCICASRKAGKKTTKLDLAKVHSFIHGSLIHHFYFLCDMTA